MIDKGKRGRVAYAPPVAGNFGSCPTFLLYVRISDGVPTPLQMNPRTGMSALRGQIFLCQDLRRRPDTTSNESADRNVRATGADFSFVREKCRSPPSLREGFSAGGLEPFITFRIFNKGIPTYPAGCLFLSTHSPVKSGIFDKLWATQARNDK